MPGFNEVTTKTVVIVNSSFRTVTNEEQEVYIYKLGDNSSKRRKHHQLLSKISTKSGISWADQSKEETLYA